MAFWNKNRGASSSTAAPAWHPDPSNPQQWRWWDGRQWTQHVAPLSQAVHVEPPASPMAAHGTALTVDPPATPTLAATPVESRQYQLPPRGRPVEPWSCLTGSLSVVGESHHEESFAALLREYGHKSINDYGVELSGAKAALIHEPDNPFDPDAIAVWVDGRHHVGYLARDEAARYAPKLDNLDRGTFLITNARVWVGKDDDGRTWGSVTVYIPEPDGLVSFNDLPDQPHVVLPSGRAIQVQGEELHMDVLRGFALGVAPRHIAATLHIIEAQKSDRSAKQQVVEVRVDEQPVGTLTKAMSEQLRDLVDFVHERGHVPVARAVIKGSTLRADVILYVARTIDVPQRWLDSISETP